MPARHLHCKRASHASGLHASGQQFGIRQHQFLVASLDQHRRQAREVLRLGHRALGTVPAHACSSQPMRSIGSLTLAAAACAVFSVASTSGESSSIAAGSGQARLSDCSVGPVLPLISDARTSASLANRARPIVQRRGPHGLSTTA